MDLKIFEGKALVEKVFGEKLKSFNQERDVTLSLRIQKGCLLTMYYIQNSTIERDAMNEQWKKLQRKTEKRIRVTGRIRIRWDFSDSNEKERGENLELRKGYFRNIFL